METTIPHLNEQPVLYTEVARNREYQKRMDSERERRKEILIEGVRNDWTVNQVMSEMRKANLHTTSPFMIKRSLNFYKGEIKNGNV